MLALLAFDIQDALNLVTPLAVTVSFLIGIPVGHMLLRGLSVESAFAGLVQVGLPFFLIVAVTRYAESAPLWEAWLGVATLYLCYAVGLAVGFWIRRRSGRQLP